MTNQAIQRAPTPGVVGVNQWQIMREQATILVKSGFLPRAIDTPEKAVAVILKGQELGIPAMYALSNVIIQNGKTTCNAELMLALIYRDHGDNAVSFEESTPDRCVVSFARRSWVTRKTHTFTMEEATRAGLPSGVNGTTWGKYPAQMLRARCVSAIARLAFPDSIAGMYTPEEMDIPVEVNPDTGEITVQATEIHPAGTPTARDAPGRPQPRQSDTVPTSDTRPAPAPAQDAPAGPAATDESTRISSALETDQQRVRAVLLQRKPGTNPTRADVTQEFITLVGADITYGNASAADWHALADALEAESPNEPDADAA